MAENFHDNEARHRFELDVDGKTAFVTYRKSPGAITLVHTEVPPDLGGQGIASKLARATLDAVRAQGQKLTVKCDFIQSFMTKHPEYNDLLERGQERKKITGTYKGSCFCGAVEFEVTGKPAFAGYCHAATASLVRRADQRLQPLGSTGVRIIKGEANIGTFHKTENSYRKYCKVCGGHLMNERPHATDRRLCEPAARLRP